MLVVLFGSLLSLHQTFFGHPVVPGYQLDLEVSWDRNERRFELVVVNIVGIGWLRLTGNDLVGRQDADQGSI
jgi:hypothetical protein